MVVVVEGFQVVLKQAADTEDNYRPACSSGFSVKLSENTGCVSLYTAADCDSRYRQLATVMPPLSTRPLPLSQLVDTTIPQAQTHTYTVLVAVIRVGAIRDIKTRQGRQTQNREVRVMDQSCTSFSLQLWDTELVQLSQSFTPYSTILLVSQCRVRYDNYRQCNVASSCCQTVITVNPDHPAVHALQQHALKHRAQYSDDHQQHTFIPESIKEQCTVKQVAERAIQLSTTDTGSGTVIVHAFITWIHSESRYKITKCGKCGRYVPENESSCISSECPGSGGQLQQDFNIRLDIADHTGGLNSILLQASTAQHTLGVNLSEFENMAEEERAQLNQKWLMELSKIWLKYQLRANGKPIFRIMHMERLS